MTSHAVEPESGYVLLGLGSGLTVLGFFLSLFATRDPRERWRKFSAASIFSGLITLFFGLFVGLASTDARALAPYVLVSTGTGAMLLGSLLWRALSR